MAEQPGRHDFLGALAAGGIVTLFCFVLLWHDPLVFWNDDYELSILPVFADVARSWSEGHLPLLSPYSWVCGNLAGEFQYGTFSVFINAIVVVIWKFSFTFPQQAAALSITHLFVLAMGGYMLARGRKLSPSLAMMVAFIAALNGWIICWGATDWFGALGAFAWLPWAWWGMERAIDPLRGRWRWVWPAPFVYLLVTGGFPYTVLMLALLTAWLAIRKTLETRNVMAAWPVVLGAAVGLGMAAPAWLALLDYIGGSAREAQQVSSHLQWRVPLTAWPALIFPSWTVRWYDFATRLMPHGATELACGSVAPLALLVATIRAPKRIWTTLKWELVLIVVVAVISMLPTAGVFRWSFRWLPLLHLAVALCAAEALRLLPHIKISPLAVAITCGFAVLMWMVGAQGAHSLPLIIVAIALLGAWFLAEKNPDEPKHWILAAVTLAMLLATYLLIPPNCGVPKYNLSQQLLQSAPLDPARLYLSVYPFPEVSYRTEAHPSPVGQEVRPGSTAMWSHLRFVNGYSPIRPAGVARIFNAGIHGQLDYDITSRMLNEEGGSNGELSRYGVDGIVVSTDFNFRPQPEDEWQKFDSSADAIVYHRVGAPFPVARAFWDSGLTQAGQPTALQPVEDSRNQVVIDYRGEAKDDLPVFVAFSRPYFRGYVARAGAQSFNVSSYKGAIPVVELPAGFAGRLTLTYRPAWLVWGGIVAAVCSVVVALGFVAAARRA